jgi:ATP-dependent Lon protease
MKTRNSSNSEFMNGNYNIDLNNDVNIDVNNVFDSNNDVNNDLSDIDTFDVNFNDSLSDKSNANLNLTIGNLEYNARGLPKRKTTLNNNYRNMFSSTESESELYELNNFNPKEKEEYEKSIIKNNKSNDKKLNKDEYYNDFITKTINSRSCAIVNVNNQKYNFNIFSDEENQYFSKLDFKTQKNLLNIRDELCKEDNLDKPLLFKILELNLDKSIKSVIYKKYKDLENLDKSSNEYYKLKTYIDNILNIPFGEIKNLEITNFYEYLNQSKEILDNVIYGQKNVKYHILEIISQYFSNNNCSGNIFGIYGPMGVGKTTIIKDGLSKVMNKPFNFISLGGAQDASFLDGHSYTYEGSSYGKIVECLIKSKCMNPIIYFDELDKISNTPKGEEIVNLLIHITDDSQNCNFQDKYFSGINIDLSKCIFVFSFNDPDKINNILKDRIQLINVDGFKKKETIKIANNFLIPKILEEFKMNNVKFKHESILYFVNNYSDEYGGVRELKHIFKKLISKINLIKYSSGDIISEKVNLKFPLNISLSLIKKLSF